jgi:hypothetical protein
MGKEEVGEPISLSKFYLRLLILSDFSWISTSHSYEIDTVSARGCNGVLLNDLLRERNNACKSGWIGCLVGPQLFHMIS